MIRSTSPRKFLLGASAIFGLAMALPAPVVGADEVVGKVGSRTITLSEVDDAAMAASIKPFQALYDARQAALQQLIGDILLENEAKKRGISKSKLEQQEINAKITAVTDADAQAWYEKNKARVRGREFDQVKSSIVGLLQNERSTSARDSFLDQLKAKTAVSMTLDPPRVKVAIAENDPFKGPKNAPVTIVEFSDFQ